MKYENTMKTDEKSTVYNFFTLAIVVSPFFRQYTSTIPGVSIADLLLGFSLVLIMVFNKNLKLSWKKVKPIILLWFFATLFSSLSFLIKQDLSLEVITRFIRFTFYTVLMIIGAIYIKKETIIKIYKILSINISIYIILQMIVYQLVGYVLPIKLLPLEWMDGRTFDEVEAMEWAARWYFRPSGIFLEPGYAAQFLLPALALSLYGWLEKRSISYISAILIFSAIILSTSSQGIFIAAIIIGIFTITNIKKNTYSHLLKSTITVMLLIICSLYFFNLDIVQISIDKITGEVQAGSSAGYRIYRGYEIFLQLPFIYQIIGVGHGNIGNYVIANSITTSYDPVSMNVVVADYVNGVQAALLYYGVFGISLLSYLYWHLFKNTNEAFRLIVVVLIILSLISGMFFSIIMVFYVALIYVGYNNNGLESTRKK